MLKTTLSPAIALLLAGTLACTDQPSQSLQIALTDAPGDGIQSAVVVIEEVYLQTEGEGRVVLRDTPVTVDLVTLANSTMTLIDTEVPEGVYSELRFVISDAWVEAETEDGYRVYATPGFQLDDEIVVDGELKTPSWDASGLKIKLRDEHLIVEGTQKILLVDFDVSESFQTETGNGDWVMRPVVVAYDIDLTTALEFNVHLGDEIDPDTPYWIELYDAEGYFEGSLMLTDADGDGIYTATFLFVDPEEGPFTTQVVTADGTVVLTLPTSLTVEGRSGAVVSSEIDLIGIVSD